MKAKDEVTHEADEFEFQSAFFLWSFVLRPRSVSLVPSVSSTFSPWFMASSVRVPPSASLRQISASNFLHPRILLWPSSSSISLRLGAGQRWEMVPFLFECFLIEIAAKLWEYRKTTSMSRVLWFWAPFHWSDSRRFNKGWTEAYIRFESSFLTLLVR